MELNITKLFSTIDPHLYSASIAETGLQDIGRRTWQNANDDAPSLITEENRDEFESWVEGFGAWEREEVSGWTLTECNALLLQSIAGDIRELEDNASNEDGEIDWQEAEELCEAGQVSGRLFEHQGEIFYNTGY